MLSTEDEIRLNEIANRVLGSFMIESNDARWLINKIVELNNRFKEDAERSRLSDIMNKAKSLLMDQTGITEKKAYQIIVGIAMDSRVSKYEVAEQLIAQEQNANT